MGESRSIHNLDGTQMNNQSYFFFDGQGSGIYGNDGRNLENLFRFSYSGGKILLSGQFSEIIKIP